MKGFYGVCLVLSLALIAIACGAEGGNNKAAATVAEPDFFSRKIEGTITVTAYDSMLYRNYLEEAARAFEALHPGAMINVETFSSMPEVRSAEQGNMRLTTVQTQDDSQGKNDYLSRINTNIMSGTGADIFAMDIIPLHKFTETLENLEPYMRGDPDFSRADYRQNILDALRYRDGTWFLPMDYTFNYYAYDTTLVPPEIAAGFGVVKTWSAEELIRLGIPLYDGSNRLFNAVDFIRGPGGMFNQLLTENIASFVNLETGRPNFIDGGFSSLLSSVNGYSQQGYILRGITGRPDAGQVMQRTMGEPTDRFYFKLNSNVSLIGQFSRSVGMMMRISTGGSAPAIESNDEIAGIQANTDGSVPFRYNQAFAINSQSKNKETAWAFIKFLLSKEMQLSTNAFNFGLPINNEAREEKAGLVFFGNLTTPNNQQRQAFEAYKAAVERLSDNINCYVVQDTSLNDMIISEAQYFFGGARNADEVARILQNKADLYLSE